MPLPLTLVHLLELVLDALTHLRRIFIRQDADAVCQSGLDRVYALDGQFDPGALCDAESAELSLCSLSAER